MLLKGWRLLALLAALLPSAWYAWEWRSMPHAAEYHDDGIYYVSAKSLAGAGRYAIESLPTAPAQTKYPPLWRAVLSIAWRVAPNYPDNLSFAILLCWLCIPVSTLAFTAWLRQAGFCANVCLALGALWALNPYIILFGTGMLSELPFTCLLLLTLLALPRVKGHSAAYAEGGSPLPTGPLPAGFPAGSRAENHSTADAEAGSAFETSPLPGGFPAGSRAGNHSAADAGVRAGSLWAAGAGILSGCAFLTRSAGIGLLPAGILYFACKRQWRHAALFAAGMLPAIIGWALWSVQNRSAGTDVVTLYYTNYLGYYLSDFRWQEAHVYIWKNLDGMLRGLGSLLLPDTTRSILEKVLAETLAIAGVIGVVRLMREARQQAFLPYAAFAVVGAGLLVIWNFPPTERLMLPLAPLWIAGLYTEMTRLIGNVGKVFQKPQLSQKIAGTIICGLLFLVFAVCGLRQWELLSAGLPQFYSDHARRLQQSEPAMEWIRANLPPDARILSENDPLLYLRTGRKGCGLEVILTTVHWYREDLAARTADHAEAATHAKRYGLDYFLLNEWDYARDMPAEEQGKLIRALREDPRLEKLFSSGPSTVYRVR